MNKSDSERLAGSLERNGYKKIDSKYQADLIVVNTCSVRQTAEDRIYGLIPRLKKVNRKARVIVTGCLVPREDVRKRLKDYVDVWLATNEILNFQTKVKCENDYLKIKPKYQSKFSAFVPIGNGCNNFCAYCVVPYARGREVYRPAKDIITEVRRLVKMGYKEIIFIAQNVNSYKSQISNTKSQTNSKFKIQNLKNKEIDFADLLKMVNDIAGDFWIKFSTSHPKDMSDKLIETMANCDKVCSYVHLPVQAGDDKVLSAMNRKYSRADYIKLVDKIRKVLNDQINSKQNLWKIPVAITTDVIVGFPGETKKQFNNTAKLMQAVKFDMAYIARYSPRPGTAAFKLSDNVSRQEKKRRESKLMKILRKSALENNKKYRGKIIKVLVEGQNKSEEWLGKTETSKNVKFPMTDDKTDLIGEFINVKIIKAQDFGLAGEIA